MRAAHQRTVALVMLVMTIMLGMGGYRLNAKWMAHEIEHTRHAVPALANVAHHGAAPAQVSDPGVALSAAEHHLLHAVGHLQTPLVNLSLSLPAVAPSKSDPPRLSGLVVPQAEPEPLLRPPRHLSLA